MQAKSGQVGISPQTMCLIALNGPLLRWRPFTPLDGEEQPVAVNIDLGTGDPPPRSSLLDPPPIAGNRPFKLKIRGTMRRQRFHLERRAGRCFVWSLE